MGFHNIFLTLKNHVFSWIFGIIKRNFSRWNLVFGDYLFFEFTFEFLKLENFAFYLMQIASFDNWDLLSSPFLLSLSFFESFVTNTEFSLRIYMRFHKGFAHILQGI